MRPVVAILGRPNVGKSTLFNRLTGRRSALVDARPGVTRDRREGRASWGGLAFTAVDTAGFEEGDPTTLAARLWQQTEAALADANVALFLVDARNGITATDRELARRVRVTATPVVLVANKCEGGAADAGLCDAYALGLGDPVPISAEHGLGLADLHEGLAAGLVGPGTVPESAEAESGGENDALRLAVVGRPNVGKSTLVNELLGHERLVVGPEPGLTHDAIEVEWETDGRRVRLIDTAGLRRRAQATDRLERRFAQDTRRAVGTAHVVVVVLDAAEALGRADLSAATQAIDEGRALVIAANKWDLVTRPRETLAALQERLRRSLPQVRGVPVVPLSARTGARVGSLMPAVLRAYDAWGARIATGRLNRWLAAAVERRRPPSAGGKPVRMRYATQAASRPPTFVVFSNRPAAVPASWVRFAVNDLRRTFDLPGVPIRLNVRQSGGRRAA